MIEFNGMVVLAEYLKPGQSFKEKQHILHPTLSLPQNSDLLFSFPFNDL